MTSDQFVFWLQGYLELSQHLNGPKDLNERQVEEIKNHLNIVLTKVTPSLPMQVPLFPNLPPFTTPVICDDSTTGKPSWPTYPRVTCDSTSQSEPLSSGVISLTNINTPQIAFGIGEARPFYHTGD